MEGDITPATVVVVHHSGISPTDPFLANGQFGSCVKIGRRGCKVWMDAQGKGQAGDEQEVVLSA